MLGLGFLNEKFSGPGVSLGDGYPEFSLDRLDMGEICPPPYGGDKCRGTKR